MIQDMKNIRYRRAIVPDDAVSFNIETLDFGDACTVMACTATYARFQHCNGQHSCQLVYHVKKQYLVENLNQELS